MASVRRSRSRSRSRRRRTGGGESESGHHHSSDEPSLKLDDEAGAASSNQKKGQVHQTTLLHQGITLSGERFRVKALPDTVRLLVFHLNTLPTMITWACGLFMIAVAFPTTTTTWLGKLPASSIVLCAFWWRVCYNVGLGMILTWQSKTAFLTRWADRLRSAPKETLQRRAVEKVLLQPLLGENALCSHEPEFCAWVVFRHLVNVILPCDVLAFALVALRYADLNEYEDCSWQSFCLNVAVSTILGGALILISVWAKLASHDVLGNYAWFWGDFFFRMDSELTFAGIFDIVPHPMYTVGYGWAYGVALISRSYTVLALALFSHFCQMIFLALAETPHIEKLYGSASTPPQKANKNRRGDIDEENVLLAKNFDLFRAADVSLLIIVVLSCAVALLATRGMSAGTQHVIFIGHAVLWRCVVTFILGGVLVQQARTGFWTRHYVEHGSTPDEAFHNWKRVYNLSHTMKNISFLLAAAHFVSLPAAGRLWTSNYMSQLFGGIMLILVSCWSFSSCWSALGDFGWFYGDFFLKPNSPLTYTGMYRFVNNPDVVLGYMGFYGVSLLCSSWEMAGLSLFSQCMNVLFLHFVEEPHMHAVYQNRVRQHSSAAARAMKQKAELILHFHKN